MSGDRIKNDATFARTRENMDEFGRADSATKLLRIAFRVTEVKSTTALIKAEFKGINDLIRGYELSVYNWSLNLWSQLL